MLATTCGRQLQRLVGPPTVTAVAFLAVAGPTASVLFVVGETEAAELVRRARSACGRTSGDDGQFWVEGRPFVVTIGPEYPEMLTEVVQSGLPRVLGWTPSGVVTVAAMCNGPEDHRLLAQLCLALCQETGGVVDFGGTLPFGPDVEGSAAAYPSSTANPAGLQGVLFSTSYETMAGSFATTHYGDADLLRAWLAHPTFHMVK
jgi:hypothetical protein